MATRPPRAVWFNQRILTVCANGEHIEGLTQRLPTLVPARTKELGRHYVAPYADSAKVTAWADANGVPVAPDVRAHAQTAWQREVRAMSLSAAPEPPSGLTHRDVRGLTTDLLPTQQVAVQIAAEAFVQTPGQSSGNHRAVLIADEPGLGKTIIALAALRITGMEASRAVIVCPTNLTANWEAEVNQHFTPHTFTAWVARGKTPSTIPDNCDVVLIGWEVLNDWSRTLINWKPDALVADEGHYAKAGRVKQKKATRVVKEKGAIVRDEHGNIQIAEVTTNVSGSVRSSALLDLGGAVARRQDSTVIALTGTPIVNRPVELEPLLDFIGILPIFGGSHAYQTRYCGARQVKIGGGRTTWKYDGASNLLELNARLAASGHYIRRTKQTLIDTGLMRQKIVDGAGFYDHHQTRTPWRITPSPAAMADYLAAEDATADFFSEQAAGFARDLNAHINSPRVRTKVAAAGARNLKKISALRLEAAKVKVPFVVAKVRELVDRGEKVVIAAHHREIVNAYADAFSGLKIQGSMQPTKVEEVKRAFNETPVSEHPVLVLSVEAGKTGHTLCKQRLNDVGPACAYMVFAEQVWTPGDEAQAQDRIWRIGQDREVRIVNAILANSIDETMYAQRARKREVVNAALDAVDPNERSRADSEKDGAGRLAQTLVYSRPPNPRTAPTPALG